MTSTTIRSRFFSVLLLAAVLALSLSACDLVSSDDEVSTFDLEVEVTYPDDFAQTEAEGVTVEATNLTEDDTQTAETNEAGIAVLEDLIPGQYELSASQELSGEAAETLTGAATTVQLSATLPPQTLDAAAEVALQLDVATAGTFVFQEVYYTGSETPEGDFYFRDQFVEIYNNTDETLFADGLYLADIHGASGQINPGTEPTPFQDEQDATYADNVWRIPGDGTDVPVDPGESLVIAQHGIDHADDPDGNPNSPVNLGDADFEMYTGRDQDVDVADVPNMDRVYFTGGFFSLVTVFGPALVLFETDDFDALDEVPVPGAPEFVDPVIEIPNDLIIDGFEALLDGESGDFKRLPLSVDEGFVTTGDTYTSESTRRLVQSEVDGRLVLQNTNNTGNDFEVIDTPTPGFAE